MQPSLPPSSIQMMARERRRRGGGAVIPTATRLLLIIASTLAGVVSADAHHFCFSGKATVSVYGKGSVPIQDLRVGDYVVTGQLVHSGFFLYG